MDEKKPDILNKYYPLIAAIAVFLLAIFVIFRPIGVIDGGSLYKTLEGAGIYYAGTPQDYLETGFNVGTPTNSGISSFYDAVIAINRAAALGSGRMPIAGVAVCYSVFLIFAIYILAKAGKIQGEKELTWTNWLLSGLLVFIFADFSYLAYFNSIFPVPALIVTILLATSLRLNYERSPSMINLVFFIVADLLLMFAGGYLAVWLAVMLGLSFLGRPTSLILCLSGVLVVVGLARGLSYQPVSYRQDLYHSVFYGVMNHVNAEDIGLSPKLNDLKKTFYSEEIDAEYSLEEEFYSKMSYKKVLSFYLSHPGALWKEFKFASANSRDISTSGAEKRVGGFVGYSSIKRIFIPNFWWVTLCIMGAFLFFAVKNGGKDLWWIIALVVANIVALFAPIVLTGHVEVGREMAGYNVLFDLLVVCAAVGGARMMVRRKSELRDKYGVTQ